MIIKYQILFILLILGTCNPIHGQTNEIERVQKLVQGYVSNSDKYLWPDLISNENFKPEILLYTEPYTRDKSSQVRNKAYFLINITGQTTKNDSLKTEILKVYLNVFKDPYVGIKRSLGEKILKYDVKYFSQETQNEIESMLLNPTDVDYNIILLAGLLNFKNQKKYIRNNFINPQKRHQNAYSSSYFKSLEWAAYLALARMGEVDCLNFVIDKIKEEKPLDIFWYRVQDLAYTRQDKATNYLTSLLESDYEFPTRQDETVRVLRVLAKSIKGFPLRYKEVSLYKSKDLEIGIKWMKANSGKFIYNMETY